MIYQKGKKIEKINHIYIHCPFCISKCAYCDFYSEKINTKFVNCYVEKLIYEFNLFSNYVEQIKSVYFGGGTPYLLNIKNLEKLLSLFKSKLNPKAEISIELNPYHFNDDKNFLKNLENIGFNRFSIGVQSFDQKILKNLNRVVPDKFIEFLEKNNKKNISLDFMFAVPGQTINRLGSDLNIILKLKPKHLSFYLFTPPKNTNFIVPKISAQEKMYFLIKNKLKEYEHYEVSNFSLKNHESIHNLAYWQRKTYLGLGAAAHSFVKNKNNEIRYSNPASYIEYIKNPLKIFEQETLDEKTKLNEKIFLGLRLLNKGVKNLFISKEVSVLIKEGMLFLEHDNLYISKDKIFLIDEITSRIISA